ncbi:hypothetical protein, partial [Halomonas sp. ND22Bw]|uniref:hypothetical protein n=1 Tax=Halomonas sp. ND22Bw TaxID=2054178 RepID=UPI001C6288E2
AVAALSPGLRALRTLVRPERGSPLLEGEGQGEVCGSSGKVTHLTPTLSFQERERVARKQTEAITQKPYQASGAASTR